MSIGEGDLAEVSGAGMRAERAVAQRYLRRVPWEMVAWGLGNCLLWLSLWPLVFGGILPLWLGFLLATLSAILGYLPSHEAQHSIIGAEGTRWRWLNELVGHASLLPLAFPYRLAWITHRQHHAHTNHPDLDPDISNRGETWLRSAYRALRARQPGEGHCYARTIRESEHPKRDQALVESFVMQVLHFGVLTSAAWSGYAIEACLLWWLPKHLGLVYIQLFLSWAPHYPMVETGRYRDTRVWTCPFGTIASMGMEYHLVHHLYPKIPLFDTPKAFRAMEGLLLAEGIRDERSQQP